MDTLTPLPVARWKLAATLEKRGRTPYALIQASGLARGTVYAIARGEAQAVELGTLVKLAAGLEKLTGELVSVSDLLELEAAPTPVEAVETRDAEAAAWLTPDVSRLAEVEPYDWQPGELDEGEALAAPAR